MNSIQSLYTKTKCLRRYEYLLEFSNFSHVVCLCTPEKGYVVYLKNFEGIFLLSQKNTFLSHEKHRFSKLCSKMGITFFYIKNNCKTPYNYIA